ncbi:MAG: hypothetical protein KDA53_05680 [Hyphomonas sp.]|nr:hypothetical protein [Hyphomonas sp.]
MSDDTFTEAPVHSTEPIDADFELAEEAPPKRSAAAGPGWIGAGAMSLMAAIAGGVIGFGANRMVPAGKGQGMGTELRALSARMDQMEEASTATLALERDIAALGERIDGVADAPPPEVDLSAIEARLDTLETAPAGGEATSDDLVRALAALNARLERVESRPAGADPMRLAELDAELSRLKADLSGRQDPDAALASVLQTVRTGEADARAEAASATALADAALALSSIEAASRRGLPFEADYRDLRQALPKLSAVRALGPLAPTGTPTLSVLTEDFAKASAAARKAVPEEESGKYGWLNRFFGGAVTVRRADGTDEGPFALISRAEDALQEGDLAGAVTWTDQLDGPPATALAAWTEGAKRRITLESSLETLRRSLAEGGAEIQ